MGQFMAYEWICRTFSTSFMRSKGSRPGMSILLMKVSTGIFRSLQTSKSLRVCFSTPFEASMTMMAQSAAVRVR